MPISSRQIAPGGRDLVLFRRPRALRRRRRQRPRTSPATIISSSITAPGPKLLSVFGGKITTARALALEALDLLGIGGLKFTATSTLPGGNVDAAFNACLDELAAWLPAPLLQPPRPRLRHPARHACSAAPTSLARSRPPFRRRPLRARGPLSDRRRIRPNRRGHPLAPHQARPGDDQARAKGARRVDRFEVTPAEAGAHERRSVRVGPGVLRGRRCSWIPAVAGMTPLLRGERRRAFSVLPPCPALMKPPAAPPPATA